MPDEDVVVATYCVGRVVGVGRVDGVGFDVGVGRVVEVELFPVLLAIVVDVELEVDALWDEWLPRKASNPNTTTTPMARAIPVPGRRRWFIESSAIRWARSLLGVVTISADASVRLLANGLASSNTIGSSGSGNSSVPLTGTGGTTRSVRPADPSAVTLRGMGRTVGGPIRSDRCSSVPRAWL